MNYNFVQTVDGVDGINVEQVYDAIDDIYGATIGTMDEYEKWVHLWKNIHASLVRDIKFFKNEKNRFVSLKQYGRCHYSYNMAGSLGRFATTLYEMRKENKKRLFNNEFPEVNERVVV